MNEKSEFFIGLQEEIEIIMSYVQHGTISKRFNLIGTFYRISSE
jgi:hypothetical protein